jgi:hypothetical protein
MRAQILSLRHVKDCTGGSKQVIVAKLQIALRSVVPRILGENSPMTRALQHYLSHFFLPHGNSLTRLRRFFRTWKIIYYIFVENQLSDPWP